MSTTLHWELRNTVVATWYARLSANSSPRRNHWQTRSIYFRATAQLIADEVSAPLTWRSIVAATEPRGSRSTFYEVAGARARHRMVDALIRDGRPTSVELALHYLRRDPVEQLIDETKVWSYWPYRQRALEQSATDDPPTLVATLNRTVADWAGQHAGLAAAVRHSPPACAAEDLTVLHQGGLAATRAAARLTDVIVRAVAAR
ncbi:hypothetical protein [Mangrovihabitans endophyticus]|uniref:Uncharacterized protein n=1 Tax=Mangrovihabitans endophyticus TaxID=1751298 RepID=A0A8J3C2L6_9ACTN|nr:hypothetical protein [Mangrovihabitans endophyticus]GGL00191.1 hypothetical protein GCM10012284_38290 [Mangrovihabitans endophyticus]